MHRDPAQPRWVTAISLGVRVMITVRSAAVVVFVATLLASAPAHAQMNTALVGERVRVHVRDDYRHRAAGSHLELRGRVTSADSNKLVMELPHVSPPVTISRADIARLDVSRGIPSRFRSGMQGLVAGAVVGALWGLAYHVLDVGGGDTEWENAMGGGAVIGGAIGATAGAVWPVERWRRVRIR